MTFLPAAPGSTKTSGRGGSQHVPQHILVFQQNRSGEDKIRGVRRYGGDRYRIDVVSVDERLPPVLDDTRSHLPGDFSADLVLDFLKHPDLSSDLIAMCRQRGIPVIASGKKSLDTWPHTPPT